MNMACRALTEREMRDLMHKLGYELHFRDGAATSYNWNKTVDGITIACTINRSQDERWSFRFSHLPGVQMLVRLTTEFASFPHPKFERWERRFLDYAAAAEAVAKSH